VATAWLRRWRPSNRGLARPVERLINDNTSVALALLVAKSLPAQ
jgi:hypothetical protein